MKILKPLPHAIMDYAWAGMMIASPWLFGFRKNRVAAAHAVASVSYTHLTLPTICSV